MRERGPQQRRPTQRWSDILGITNKHRGTPGLSEHCGSIQGQGRDVAERSIPLPVIPVVAEALKDAYSESKLRGLFAAAGIEIPAGPKTKVQLCMACLAWANNNHSDPLTTLGGVIGELMDRRVSDDDPLAERQKQITVALRNSEYEYKKGGEINVTGTRFIRSIGRVLGPPPASPAAASSSTKAATPPASEPEKSASLAPTKRKSATTAQEGRTPPARLPTLFIGSTVDALPIARAVHAELDHDLEVTIWNHGLFSGGAMTWSQLLNKTAEFDFALFVFSGEDEVTSKGETSLGIRDNVLIEYGLFVGALGHERVFFMFNRDARPKIASDLAGVTPLTYANRADKNLRAAVSPAADEIRQAAQRLGRRGAAENP